VYVYTIQTAPSSLSEKVGLLARWDEEGFGKTGLEEGRFPIAAQVERMD